MDGVQVPLSKIDVVFVPLLAVDMHGNRIGYGKGFYDEFLGQCRKDTIKIGLSLFEPENESISDINVNDVRLDYCITPEAVYKF